MCTVTFVPTVSGFIFTSNRDETPLRAADSFVETEQGGQKLYFPQDQQAKGTWFAFSNKSRFGCVLNGAFVPHVRKQKYRMSRGKMALSFFDAKNIDAFLNEFDFKGMEPFTFLVFDQGDFRELRWDEKEMNVRRLNLSSVYLWSSATLYNSDWWHKRQRSFKKFAHSELDQKELIEFHKNQLPFSPSALQDLLGVNKPLVNVPVTTTSVSSLTANGDQWSFNFESMVHDFHVVKSVKAPYLSAMSQKVIAIDGYASTGKSTLSKLLAERLGYQYVDTGYMFRVVAFGMLKNGIDIHRPNKKVLQAFLEKCHFSWVTISDGSMAMGVEGKVYGDELRTPQVSAAVSPVATLKSVRSHLLLQQRELSKHVSVVMDGRDIGTVVFPRAQYKFFLTADPAVRAQRRWEEMRQKGQEVNFDQVLQNVIERDKMDSNRAIAPLKKAKDAIEINTTSLNVNQVLELLLEKLQN